jgi:glucokinase
MLPSLLGVDIGGTAIELVIGDPTPTILARVRFDVDSRESADGVRAQIEAALPPLLERWKPSAVGVGVCGPVDWHAGVAARSFHVEGWADFEIRRWLQALTRLPVAVENDANTAALAEAAIGAGAGGNPVFYFNLDRGVGGGLVMDRHLYHGSPPGEAEFGHLRLDRNGATVENRCSGAAIDRRLRTLADAAPDGTLANLIGPIVGGESQHLRAALDAGDAAAAQVLEELAADLGFALSHVVHLFHPEIIVMGGGLARVGEPLRAAIERHIPAHLLPAFRGRTALTLAACGADAVPVGALLLAWEAGVSPPY